ncbi:helix-turn-helix domain-containing protein [Paenibacillus sp. FSL R7-0297]|uniref:winged helix-turn-helix transcriptional regulator n=1 Tax=Paenibacillus sp. FSL R7-0297 TaxID=2921680 RepID=UPI0030F56911
MNNQEKDGLQAGRQLTILEDCTVTRQILDRVGDKWSMLIIVNLGAQSLRFKELQRRSGGISQRMLTQTLRHLERDGLVWRKATPTVPLTVEYGLTSLGESILGPLTLLVEWVNGNLGEIARARVSYDSGHGEAGPAARLEESNIESETKPPHAAEAIGAE